MLAQQTIQLQEEEEEEEEDEFTLTIPADILSHNKIPRVSDVVSRKGKEG
jgi:hypothetical protein